MTIDTDKYEGHTPADQWTIYKMGADKPYHAVRFGQRGLDLELEFGADAQLIADAPLLLAEVKRLQKQVLALLDENQRLEAMYHMDVHGDDTLAKLLERKK